MGSSTDLDGLTPGELRGHLPYGGHDPKVDPLGRGSGRAPPWSMMLGLSLEGNPLPEK